MSKEHAYAYEAGYRDGSIHYELEHCPACKNIADLQKVLIENYRLRELVEVGLRCCDHKCDGCKFLRCGLCHIDEFEDEARKLGVEVTE